MRLTEKPVKQEESSAADQTFGVRSSYRITLKDEESAQLAGFLDTAITDMLATRDNRGWDANWDLWEDLYFGITPERPIKGQANVHVPLAAEVCDTIDAVVDQAIFTAPTWLGVEPREKADVDVVKRKEQFLDYALKVEMKAREKLEPIRFDAAVLGTGVGHLPWLREMDRVRDEERYDGANQVHLDRFQQRYPNADKDYPDIVRKLRAGKIVDLVVEYNEPIHDAPSLEYVPLRDWIVRDTAEYDRLHREPFVGHRIHRRWDDIVTEVEEGYYDDILERLKSKYNPDSKDYEAVQKYEEKDFEIFTGIVRWRRKGEKRERRYLVDFHKESRTICRILNFPYWHNRVNYIPFYYQRSRKYIYGISIIQKIEQPQMEANAAHSLLIDSISYSALPMFKARKGTENDFNPLRDGMYPGKVWYFTNPQTDAEQFQMNASSALSVLAGIEGSAMRHAELASGATQNLSGLESARDPNAPAAKALQQTQQAMMRVGRYIATFSVSLVELGFQTLELYYQFSPQGKVFRVMGANGEPVFPVISRQELRLRADLYPHGNTAALNPDKRKQDTLEAAKLALEFPEVKESPLKRMTVLELVLDQIGTDWQQKKHKFLPTPKELELLRKIDDLNTRAGEQKVKAAEAQVEQVMSGRLNPNPQVNGPVPALAPQPAAI